MKAINKSIIQSYPPKLPSGCVFYSDMQEKGNKIIDHAMSNNGAVLGATTHPNGRKFDGYDDTIKLGNTDSVNILNAPLSIFCWIKLDPSAFTGYLLCKNTASPSDIQYSLHYDNTNLTYVFRLNGNTNRAVTPLNSAVSGKFQLVGAVWDGINAQMFINKQKAGSPGPYSGTLPSSPNMYIGSRNGGGVYIKGVIGEFWIFKKALSQTDVINLFEKTADKYGIIV